MTLYLRTAQTLTTALFKEPMKDINEVLEHQFRVLPIDIDVYGHMNHAKYLNYLEAARWDLQYRSGFLKIALKKGWIGPLSHVELDYYRPLKAFDKFKITTQFIAFEEKWLYIFQRVWKGEKEAARAFIKSTIRKGRENIPPETYLEPLGFKPEQLQIPDELQSWVSEKLKH